MTSKPIAVVTGASRGAGKGIADALSSHGCSVYVAGRSEREGVDLEGKFPHRFADYTSRRDMAPSK